MIVTFVGCLALGAHIGVVIGVVVNLFIVLHRSSRIEISCELFDVGTEKILVLSPFQNLYFPAADAVRKKIRRCLLLHQKVVTIIVINGYLVKRIDATVADVFAGFQRYVKKSKKKFVFWNWAAHPKNLLIRTEPRFELSFRDASTLETLLEGMDIVVPKDLTERPFYQR